VSVRIISSRDWFDWHERYDRPEGWHAERLVAVQRHIHDALDRTIDPLRVVSVCAGQGRDLLGALDGHPRAAQVHARLVELDERNVRIANDSARAAGFTNVKAVVADAGVTDSYLGAVPADVVLVCGVFGNLNARDTETTIRRLAELCAPDAIVICTHGRRQRSLTHRVKRTLRTRRAPWGLSRRIRRWFREAGFEEVRYERFPRTQPKGYFSVASYRFRGAPAALRPATRLFTFDGPGALWR
jgi:Methyltransferase domain